MRTIYVENRVETVYDVSDFPYELFGNIETVVEKKARYADVLVSFDIETTTILKEVGKDFGFMYVWQMAVGFVDRYEDYVCMGRTWPEWMEFMIKLQEAVGMYERRIIVWVHFLGFEFQFFRNFLDIDEIFARKSRKPIWVRSGNLEFRCSMFLSNMGLAKFTQKTPGVIHVKQDGEEFNYSILRYPDTYLTDKEIYYCVCDVVGLNECIRHYLKEDTLATIPLTSTGFVRRDYRERCLRDSLHMRQFKKNELSKDIYVILKEASRGAISGSSHLWTDETLEDVDSFDIKSSYPYNMMTRYFPNGSWQKADINCDCELFRALLDNYCCVITWSTSNLELKRWSGIPYISKAKCKAIEGGKYGNGKVYGAKLIGMTCTEIDFRIIEEDYKMGEIHILEMWYCTRKQLSYAFRSHLIEMFQFKTDLEDGDKFLYNKYKNKINASFGMMLTDIVSDEITYDPKRMENGKPKIWKAEKPADIDAILKRYYNGHNSFLSYQHGVWVLAHARDCLHDGMKIVGSDLVQVDTDSVKTLGDYKEEFKSLNAKIMDDAERYDIKPYAMKNGEKVYLGIWEHEDDCGSRTKYTYEEFRTLGAKKYCYVNNSKMGITVAGLSKSASKWLYSHGGIEKFTNGTDVPPGLSGRTASTYNDVEFPRLFIINGHEVFMGSNIGVRNVPYTFGITSEWLELIADGKVTIDSQLPGNGAYDNLIAEILDE